MERKVASGHRFMNMNLHWVYASARLFSSQLKNEMKSFVFLEVIYSCDIPKFFLFTIWPLRKMSCIHSEHEYNSIRQAWDILAEKDFFFTKLSLKFMLPAIVINIWDERTPYIQIYYYTSAVNLLFYIKTSFMTRWHRKQNHYAFSG